MTGGDPRSGSRAASGLRRSCAAKEPPPRSTSTANENPRDPILSPLHRAGRVAAAAFVAFLGAWGCGSTDDVAPPADTVTAPPTDVGDTAEPADTADGHDAGEAGAPFTVVVFDQRLVHSVGEVDVRAIEASADFGAGPFAAAVMRVELGTTCYPFDTWADNPPPPGHVWPADCDAFDRGVEVLLDPPAGIDDPPGLELVRAVTPFGGPMAFEVDVTDVLNGLGGGERRARVNIGTWPDPAGQVSGAAGRWAVSVRFDVTPGPAPRRVLAVIPLADRALGPDERLTLAFDVPDGAVDTRLEYRATGHGGGEGPGCIGPAEEFCERTHAFTVDGEAAFLDKLWLDSCAQHCTLVRDPVVDADICAENPCGLIASVRAPRANWCPGAVTPPLELYFDALSAPGRHTVEVDVAPLIAPGGLWRVSATLFVFDR